MFDITASGVKPLKTAVIHALNVDYIGQEGNKHLQFLSQGAASSAEKHHAISDREVTGQSGATLN